jgi:hypothetical protein
MTAINSMVVIITWWSGVVALMAVLAGLTFFLGLALKEINVRVWRHALSIMHLSTARYWVDRMESEGLTICRKEYRRMVAQSNPRTVDDYQNLEAESHKKDPA